MIEIKWKPDKGAKEPLYAQIVKYAVGKIKSGDWAQGEKLPPQRDLAALFGVNRSTIVKAMDELYAYGLLEGAYGGGTVVTGGSWSLKLAEPPDWNTFIRRGAFQQNKPEIQTINRIEYEPGYIRLSTGELSPSLYPYALMKKTFKNMPERIPDLGYLGTLGLPELRKILAEYLKKTHGIDAGPENILITTGALQALHLISVSIFKKGSTVYTETPTYLKSLEVFQSAGMMLSGLPMDAEGLQYWRIQNAARDANTSLIYSIPSFHNPTGIVMSAERREGLLRFCRKNGIPLVEDDAYGRLWIDEEPPAPIKAMDESGSVVYLGTLSKTLVPGLRIGWVVGPEALVYRLGDVKMQTDYGSSSVSQWMACELISGGGYDDYVVGLRKELRARRDAAAGAVSRYFKGLAEWTVPKGGFYIWLRFKEKLNMNKVFSECLKKGVLINPGNVYDYAENNAVRVSYSYADPEELERALSVLASVVQKETRN